MKPRVHIATRVPDHIRAAVAESFELVDLREDADGILASIDVSVDGDYLAAASRATIVANIAVGVDNIDLDAARRRGLVVANAPGVLTYATAELTIALMLTLLRRVAEGDRLLRSGEPWSWALDFMLGESLRGKQIGIVGPGRIGREVARLAEAFGAHTSFAGRNDPLQSLLDRADIVSLHCPLTPETRHLIDADALARMKPTAVLVNAARGPVVAEAALVEALRTGRLAGAALDVYEYEPLVSEELLSFENVVLAPHLGSATHETRTAMAMLAVDALRTFLLEGRLPDNRVSP
ncbi:MAG: 2-hydroxyacid dehydrogenase [Gaiellaceae bacterium]